LPADLEYGEEEDESEDRAADDKARCMTGTLERSGLRKGIKGRWKQERLMAALSRK
jgi:hypothetical protein